MLVITPTRVKMPLVKTRGGGEGMYFPMLDGDNANKGNINPKLRTALCANQTPNRTKCV